MAKYFETLYKYQVNAGMTTAAMNARLKHIDDRIDALENRMAHVEENEFVSGEGHTHTVSDRIGIFLPGKVTISDIGPNIMVDASMTVKTVRAACRLNSGAATVDVAIQKSVDNGANWTSIMTSNVNIEPGELTSTTASTQPVVNPAVAALTAGNLIRLYVVAGDDGVIDLTVTIKSDVATSA